MKLRYPHLADHEDAGGDWGGERATLQAVQNLDDRAHHNRECDREHDDRKHWPPGEWLNEYDVNDHAECRAGGDDGKYGNRERQAEQVDGGDGKVRAERDQHALREIKDIGCLEDDCESQGHQTIDTAECDSAEQDLNEHDWGPGMVDYFMYLS